MFPQLRVVIVVMTVEIRSTDEVKQQRHPILNGWNDNLLDINNAIDMEDHFYNREGGSDGEPMSPDTSLFTKKDQNSQYIQSHVVEINRR